MGALNFKKYKAHQVSALLTHCDKEERKKHKHSNKHIDVSQSHKNFQVKNSYGAYEFSYKDRIKFLDRTTNKNKRKNRVTCVGLNIKPPDHFPVEKYNSFFAQSIKFYIEKFGDENFINAYVHYDEVHEYLDAETGKKRLSVPEAHFFFVPELDGQLNASELVGNSVKLTQYHNEFEKFINERFNVKFHTGKAKKTGRSTEELKNMSEQLEIEQMTKELDNVKSNVSFYEDEVKTLKQQKTDLTNDVKALQSDKQQLQSDKQFIIDEINEQKQQVIDAINEEKQRVLGILDSFDDVKSQDIVNFDRFETFCADDALRRKGLEVSERNSKYLRTMKKRYEEDKVKRAKQCKQYETQRLNEISTVSEERQRKAVELLKQTPTMQWQEQEQKETDEWGYTF